MDTDTALINFMQQMEVKNFTFQTRKHYSWHLNKFFEFSKISPLRLSSQLVNNYLVAIKDKSTSFRNQAINAIRFFFTNVLNRKTKDWLVIRPIKAKTQPILLSDDELKNIFAVCKNKKHYSILSLMYSAGLRVSDQLKNRRH